jgi:sodium/potassium-transporting ATPase subunit alpha
MDNRMSPESTRSEKIPTKSVEDLEANREPHIAFEPPFHRGRDDRGSSSRQPSRRRSRSAGGDSINSIHSRANAASAETGVKIQFRTLSIQVSESRQIKEIEASSRASAEGDQEYFARMVFHKLSPEDVCQQFNVLQNQGLSGSGAAARLQRDGPNSIPPARTNYLKKIFFYVFGGFCSVLWVGVIIFFVCWKPLSNPPSPVNLALAILVLIVIFLQASFSAFQDWSTQRVMNSILDLLPSEALVLRDGNLIRISTSNLVVGDIVHISIGNKVPVDMRLLTHSGDVRFDRSILTGESDEIEGAINATDENLLESRNIALMGTMVTNGHATGIVVLTGAKSVMGRIAKATNSGDDTPTLIQIEINRFVMIIVGLTIILACLILLSWTGWLRLKHYAFMNVVAMLNDVMGCVVAFIPEGMPVGVALTLMMVARRMKAANVLPKGLTTVETLGCVNVICSDKTGTLTENKMSVTTVAFVDQLFASPGDAQQALSTEEPKQSLVELHRAAILCNDASFDPVSIQLPVNERMVQGNATDGAVLRFAESGRDGAALRGANHRVFEIPFNSKNKWMLTMYRANESSMSEKSKYMMYLKGAPDVLLPACKSYWSGKTNSILPLDAEARARFSELQDKLSKNAERVIVLCQRQYVPFQLLGTNDFTDEINENALQDLTIIGILGITDPPRQDAAETIVQCRKAGIRFFMVTGDYSVTAAAIARNIGIFTGTAEPDSFEDVLETKSTVSRKSLLLDSASIARLNNEAWDIVCQYEEIVFARTTPEQKLRIVNEFKDRDNVVAVTGDGVNDAPALSAANVGVAVVSGSDVAIQAADLILLDSFASIVDAIRLGRLVFQNLQKVIAYLLPAGSWSEIWPVLLNVFFGVPLPLSSFLMIIICVFTDLFLSLSLIMEKEEFDLLSLPPRNHKKDHLINFKIYAQAYLFTGVMETICAHSMFFLYMWKYAHIPISSLFFAFESYTEGFYGYTEEQLIHFNAVGQSVYFVTLVILQWGNVLSVRNKRLSILVADPFRKARRNPWLILSAVISLSIAIFVTEVPGIQSLFGTAKVPVEFWLYPLPLAVGILCMDETRKAIVRGFPNSLVAKIAW